MGLQNGVKMNLQAKGMVVLLTAALGTSSCTSKGAEPQPIAQEDTSELAAILAVVERTYEVSSFTDANQVDPDDFREPFTPSATLAYTRDGQLIERTVDEYVELRREMLQGGELQSLEEWELHGESVYFGNLAHRTSTYAVRVNGQEQLAERGVMSFQLLKIAGEWKVHSLAWQAESADLTLPDRHLP